MKRLGNWSSEREAVTRKVMHSDSLRVLGSFTCLFRRSHQRLTASRYRYLGTPVGSSWRLNMPTAIRCGFMGVQQSKEIFNLIPPASR
jgi:hypothetical protein